MGHRVRARQEAQQRSHRYDLCRLCDVLRWADHFGFEIDGALLPCKVAPRESLYHLGREDVGDSFRVTCPAVIRFVDLRFAIPVLNRRCNPAAVARFLSNHCESGPFSADFDQIRRSGALLL